MNITIKMGDITKLECDAIVNAANSGMLNGGGVDGAIRKAAGAGLQEECIKLRKENIIQGLKTGEAVITSAYNLPAKIIIHTVGPRYYSEDITLLKNCYVNCLKLAEENNFKSIVFPAISTGVYGCPIEKSVEIVKEVLSDFNSNIIQEIIFVLAKREHHEAYKRLFNSSSRSHYAPTEN